MSRRAKSSRAYGSATPRAGVRAIAARLRRQDALSGSPVRLEFPRAATFRKALRGGILIPPPFRDPSAAGETKNGFAPYTRADPWTFETSSGGLHYERDCR